MRFLSYIVLAFIIAIPVNVIGQTLTVENNTDGSSADTDLLSAPYDLRERKTFLQVTNTESRTINIHIQIFQHDKDCDELNFFDTLTANDTVVYDLDNIVKNDGSVVPINLDENSSGYVVIVQETFINTGIIGNFRIIDNSGYEYRANMASWDSVGGSSSTSLNANFNTVHGAKYSDLIGYAFNDNNTSTFTGVRNYDPGVDFDIFVFDLNEEPLSCDTRNFSCGNIMNYGVNEDYRNSKDDPLLCPGASLADPKGGYVLFDNFRSGANLLSGDLVLFIGLVGINNNDGTGSIDYWFEIGGEN